MVVSWLELLLHVGQLLDQALKGDSPLGRLLPALAHQLVHLSNMNCIRLQVVKNAKPNKEIAVIFKVRMRSPVQSLFTKF